MKYIRTKDGKIIKLIAYKLVLETPTLLKFEYMLNGGILFVQKDNFLKQADTIEELCDEFIVVHKNGNHVIQKKVGNGLKDMDKDYPKYLERNNQVFYGAIWTNKGLIYVAKMNDKGELELV